MTKTVTYYKIRHRVTGLYSKGGDATASGVGECWNKSGKMWATLGALRNHLRNHMPKKGYRVGTDMSDWEVVEYHVVEADVKPVSDMLSAKQLTDLLGG